VDTQDLVSILVPVFNGEQFIGRTLDSLFGQTHRNFEIIVVNDGSTDKTMAIVEGYALVDPRIRIFHTERKGPPGARNYAAQQARGQFIAPCDSDDLWRPEKLERQVAALRCATPTTGVAYCWSVGINAQDEVIFPTWARHVAEGRVLMETIIDSLTGSGSVPLIRREFFDKVGGFPEDIYHGDEWQICIALAAICEFVVVREYLVAYRGHNSNTSADYLSVEDSLARSTRWISGRWPGLPPKVLRRRAFVINSYLAFLAVKAGHCAKAIKYQMNAFKAVPSKLLSPVLLNLCLLIAGRYLGIQRYYYYFWRAPLKWQVSSSASKLTLTK
jgi:glycosyltransferase involved in cell wall biosynthesis